MCNSAIYAILCFCLLQAFPVTIGGFVNAVEFAPATEKRIDTGWCDRLTFASTELDEVGGGELLRKECEE